MSKNFKYYFFNLGRKIFSFEEKNRYSINEYLSELKIILPTNFLCLPHNAYNNYYPWTLFH